MGIQGDMHNLTQGIAKEILWKKYYLANNLG